jgi:hypothetical protein
MRDVTSIGDFAIAVPLAALRIHEFFRDRGTSPDRFLTSLTIRTRGTHSPF